MAEEVAVAVCVRVKPLSSRELEESTHVYWKTDNNAIYQIDGSKSFSFDRVFHSDETTKNVYDEIAVPIIDSAIQGYNGTVFAYGQTASGKTHTMMGSEDCLGVIPRAIHDIFQKVKKFPEREFLLRVSYMEIYNETITDLLCNTQKMKPLIIREDINRNVYVADLTEEVVYTSEMALQWLSKGEKNRHYGITKMNQRSSRSHTIFRMILESRENGESSNVDGSIKVSHLNLVDLAGSERAAQTGAEGVRLKEGCNINRSLFILGQVIKKLSDEQTGGFINYRDSKLTRILQNSLGGNAKTRIICTITPVSFDETLTTLQFASTAKYMKNTPFVNEVSSDEALLKRYRKEIMDLKKQLEEVSIKTRAQEVEKDQLAQLLEEKGLLQKVQDEKIQNLQQMLVTSSSIDLQQELKAKKKRRVTWCLGKINKMKDSTNENEFEISTNITTRSRKASVTVLGERDESLCFESDTFSNTLEPLTEIEWSSATKLLSQENLEGELNSLHAKYDNLVLDNEQLRRQNEDLELQLKEKQELDEFEALERKLVKEQEIKLMDEISNLKDLVKHAESYNQNLENELSSKVELLRDKEDQIKNLQKCVDVKHSDTIKMDLSYSSETTEDLKQMKQTLLDTETVALDAKRESAFLRSENLELKEKIKELLNSCIQMENDIHLYRCQLEAEKKAQADLDKELQSSFNEITRLTSLIDGKVPKDLLHNLELERRITDLQKKLDKETNDNETLKKEVNLLSELKPLSSEVDMLRTEIHKKSEELTIVTSEKEKLSSEVVDKDSKIQSLLDEMGKTKGDLAACQLNYKNIDDEFQNFKTLHTEFERKYKTVLEENDRLKQELSGKTEELQQKTAKSQDRLDEVEQLKEQLENKDSLLRSVEKEKSLLTEKLRQTEEEVKALTQDKSDLQQLQESLQTERDQLRSEIQDTIATNIDTEEQLHSALQSLKQSNKVINTLKRKISKDTSGTVGTVYAKGELQQEDLEKEDELRIAHVHLKEHQETIDKLREVVSEKTAEIADVQRDLEHANATLEAQTQELQEKEDQLVRAKDDLKDFMYQTEQLKKQIKTQNSVLEFTETEKLRLTQKLHENLEEIRIITEENDGLKIVEETLRTERDQLRESLRKIEANIPVLNEEHVLLPNVREVSECPETVNELELLEEQSKPMDSTSLENLAMERLKLMEKLQGKEEEKKHLNKPKDNWKMLKGFQLEYNLLKEGTTENFAEIQEPQNREKEGDTTKIRSKKRPLKRQSKTRYSAPPRIDVEKLPGSLEGHDKVDTPHQVQKILLSEQDHFTGHITEVTDKHLEAEEELKIARCCLKEKEETINRLTANLSEKEYEISSFQRQLELANNELQRKIQELYEEQEELNRIETQKAHEKGNELEQLKELLITRDSVLQIVESDGLELNKRHEDSQEEIKIITKDKNLKCGRGHTNREQPRERKQKKLWGKNRVKQQELEEEENNLLKTDAVNDTAENTCLTEHLKEQLAAKGSALEHMEMQNVRLTQTLNENLEAMQCVIKERDDLKSVEKTLKAERDQLKENLQLTITKDLEKEDELRIAHVHLKEHQETIDKLREVVSEKTAEIADVQRDLEHANATLEAQTQELQEKEDQLIRAKDDLKDFMYQTEQLKKQIKTQNSALEFTETEKLRLTQKLHENLEEIRIITEENDGLKIVEETLRTERDQLRESLRETEVNIQELKANELELFKLKGEVSEAQKQLKEQGETLHKVEMENLNLAQKLHENIEEIKSLVTERDNLRKAEEILKLERDQLKENLQEVTAKDLDTQQELKIAHLHLKEQEESIDKLRQKLEEKTTQISDIQKDLDKSKDELQKKIQELLMKELQLFKEDISKNYTKTTEIEQLKKQCEAQHLSVQSVATSNFHLIKNVYENLEELRNVAKECNELRKIKQSLKMERDQFRESIRKTKTRDHQNHKEGIQHKMKLLHDAKQHPAEKLRGKCRQIKELLKRYSEMDTDYECLDRLSLDLEKEIETQKELSVRVKGNLYLPYSQTKQIQKLLAENQRCSIEFHRVMKKLKYVLSHVTRIKEEQHESINKLEFAFVDEVEKQHELQIKIQCLELDYNVPASRELKEFKLNPNIDLHIEEILKDFSENDFPSVKTELQQLLRNLKEMCQFLEEWLSAPFDIEELKLGIQKENNSLFRVNNFYNDKITAIINESTEFEERSAVRSKDWKSDLKVMKENTKKLLKDYQSLTASQSSVHVCPTTPSSKTPCVASGHVQLTAEKIQELETSLHEAKESALHKEDKIIKLEEELKMTNDIIAKLETKVNESNKHLEKSKETIQILQDKVALGAKPYKEEIEDLKTKLVKTDLEKMKNAKDHEKEINSTKATIEHQKEMIRVLRENLRRNQQVQDTSMISDQDLKSSEKPLTCGGGSGIIQSTKALILKSEYVRLAKEVSKLNQQNKELTEQKNELLHENHHLCSVIKTWKERVFKREAYIEGPCENSPKSPKVTRTGSKKLNTPSQFKEWNFQDPVLKESPKSSFFDSRSKSLPACHPVRYFDNSSLGLFPEEQTIEANTVDAKPDLQPSSSREETADCKMQ